MRYEFIIYWSIVNEAALQQGMEAKSKEFVEKGAEVCTTA